MKRPALLLLLLVSSTFGCADYFGGFEPRSEPCPELEEIDGEPKILAIGDSIFAWKNQTCRTAPDILALELDRVVKHKAVNGARFSGGTYPVFGQYESGDWDWVVVTGGANDLDVECECGVDCQPTIDRIVDREGIEGQLPRLVDMALADGANVLLFGYPEVRDDALYGFDECTSELDELRRRKERMAAFWPDLVFVDGREIVDEEDNDLFDLDNVHPSPDGARLIGETIADRITEFELGQ